MGLERAGAWVAAYFAVGLALFHAGVVGRDGPAVLEPLWLPTAIALEVATGLRDAAGPALDGGAAYWAVVLVVLALEGAALVGAWWLVRLGAGRLAGALANP